MDKSEILKKLFSLQRFGIKPGLERTEYILSYLDNPETRFISIHIAGTNGKGTVASLLASIMMEAGFRTALYTSPHIMEFNERIRINGEKIPDEYLVDLAKDLLPVSAKVNGTFFEITTAMAFKYFADNNCDIAIIETGMGGRFDATNVIEPILAIITSIGLDHQQYLGDTLESIAFEKAGIIKKNSTAIVSERNPILRNIFEDVAVQVDAELFFTFDDCTLKNLLFNDNFTYKLTFNCAEAEYQNIEYNFGGGKAADNIITAIYALNKINAKFPISLQDIINGVKNVVVNTGYRARIELLRESPPLIIDVAHNPDAINELVNTIIKCIGMDKDWTVVFAAMNDKEIEKMLKDLRLISNEIILTQPKIERASKVDELREFANNCYFEVINCIENVGEAVKFALSLNKALIITGSFYLIGESIDTLKNYGFKIDI